MRKISFRKVILASSFFVYFIFSLFLFLYFNGMYYQNIKQQLISENNSSAKAAGQFLDTEKDSLSKDARFVVNYPVVHFAFTNGKYIDFYSEKEFDISNPKFEEMNNYKYTEMSYQLSRIIGKNIYVSGLSDINVSLFDQNATLLSNVPGIEDSFTDTGNESYIRSMVSKENQYSSIDPIGTIALKDGRLFLKGIDRVYSGEPRGVTVVTIELSDATIKKIKTSVNKEIAILAENEVKLSTLPINKNAFGNISDTLKQGNFLFKTFKIENEKMGFSFYPIKDFDGKVIAYIGTGFNMDTVNDIYISNMYKLIPAEAISSLFLFFILYILIRRAFKPFSKIINVTEEISKGNYQVEYPSINIQEFSTIMESISKMSDAIKSREEELIKISNIDKLTQIYNRLKTEDILNLECGRSKRYNSTLSVIMLDIDHFKEVNDTYGHEVGDIILTEFAGILKSNVREVDYLGRWGGEEFLIICPETSLEGATTLALNLKQKIENYNFPVVSQKTASFGVATLISGEEVKSVMKRVDEALYKAKKLGRNRVEVSG